MGEPDEKDKKDGNTYSAILFFRQQRWHYIYVYSMESRLTMRVRYAAPAHSAPPSKVSPYSREGGWGVLADLGRGEERGITG